jgi:hypothetical protein
MLRDLWNIFVTILQKQCKKDTMEQKMDED